MSRWEGGYEVAKAFEWSQMDLTGPNTQPVGPVSLEKKEHSRFECVVMKRVEGPP